MTLNAPPSINPADLDSLTGTFRNVFSKFLQNVDTCLPAQVIAFDRSPPASVQIQPLIKMITTAGESVSRAQIAKVPVMQLGAGGFIMSFNVSPGDLGILLANDRDISLFIQSFNETQPNSMRIKNFADAMFLPLVFNNYAIAGEDANNLVIQDLSGGIKIALGNSKIKMLAPNVEIDSAVVINGSLTVNGDAEVTGALIADSALTVNGALSANGGFGVAGTSGTLSTNIGGDVFVTGNISATGNITPHV